MKNKSRVIATVVMLFFSLGLLAGCGGKSPKVAVSDAMNKEVKSMKFEGEMKLALTGANNDPSAELLKDLKITFDGVSQKEPQKAIVNLQANIMNTTMEVNMYIDGKKMYMKIPMQEKYASIDLDKLDKEARKNEAAKNSKKHQELSLSFMNELYSSIDEKLFKEAPREKINGESSKVIKIELNNKAFNDLIAQFIKLAANAKYKNLFSLPATDPAPTDIEKSMKELEKTVNFNKLISTIAINGKGYMNRMTLEADITSREDKSGMKLTMSTVIKDINKKQDFKMPEFNDSNTIPYEKMMEGFGALDGAGLGGNGLGDTRKMPPGMAMGL